MILYASCKRYEVAFYYYFRLSNNTRFFSLSHDLISKAKRKAPESAQYRKLWRYYCHQYYQEVRTNLQHNIGSKINLVAGKSLEYDLGAIGADSGVMPNFTNIGALRFYALNHFGRARLMGDLLVQPDNDWLSNRVSELFGGKCEEVQACSLGGGPGYDFLSLSALTEFRGGPCIRAVVYDYECSWKDIVSSMEKAVIDVCTNKQHTCSFGTCNITQPLNSAINNDISNNITSINVFTCSYCIVENAVKLLNTNFVFFRDLFAEASNGTLFLFADTTHRMWPALIDIAREIGDLRITSPYICAGKCGWQLVFLKDTSQDSSYFHSTTVDSELYNRFMRDYEAHSNRLARGWKRDHRKIRGSKNE